MGLPIIGAADESPYFDKYAVPARISKFELLKRAQEQSSRLEVRIKADAAGATSDLLQAVYDNTPKELKENR